VAQTGFWTGKLKIKTGDALAKFVLSDFNKGEQEKLDKEVFPRVNEVLLSILKDGCDKTMNKFN
jgi:peptidyl-tRNA hydrolase